MSWIYFASTSADTFSVESWNLMTLHADDIVIPDQSALTAVILLRIAYIAVLLLLFYPSQLISIAIIASCISTSYISASIKDLESCNIRWAFSLIL